MTDEHSLRAPVGERPERSFRDTTITLSHGSGGKASHQLIESVFVKTLSNPLLDRLDDHALLAVDGASLAFTTDSYVVDPLFFPGGDIGKVAVNGTVNDLSTSGAEPLYLSLGVILEEGFPVSDLRRIVASIGEAAEAAGVRIVTGDTKVVHRRKADKLFLNTAGVGVVRHSPVPSLAGARPGDRVLLSGPIGDHGVTILAARGDLDLELSVESDTAPLNGLVRSILDATDTVHCLKDPTRGGVATALNEIALQSNVCVMIDEESIPVRTGVRGACEILGIDPLYVANEGRLLVVVPAPEAEAVLSAMREHELGSESRLVGEVRDDPKGAVLLRTAIGGTRIVDMLVGDALPRIC